MEIEYSVVSVEVAWYEDDFDMVFRSVVHVEPVHLVENHVLVEVVDVVCEAWVAAWEGELVMVFEAFLEFDARTFYP